MYAYCTVLVYSYNIPAIVDVILKCSTGNVVDHYDLLESTKSGFSQHYMQLLARNRLDWASISALHIVCDTLLGLQLHMLVS